MNTSVIQPECIRRKSEVTGHYGGEEGEEGGWVPPRLAAVTLSSPLSCRPCRSFHTQRSALAPRSFSILNNGERRSSRRVLPNCFPSLLVCFLSEVMNGHGGLWCRLRSGRHFYETKILIGDLREVREAGKRTNLAASKAVCGEIGGYCY